MNSELDLKSEFSKLEKIAKIGQNKVRILELKRQIARLEEENKLLEVDMRNE